MEQVMEQEQLMEEVIQPSNSRGMKVHLGREACQQAVGLAPTEN